MRAAYGLLLGLALIGCGRVDSNRTTALDEPATPGARSADRARLEANRTAEPPASGVAHAPGPRDAATGSGAIRRDLPAHGEATVPATDPLAPSVAAPARTAPASDVSPTNTAINERDRAPAAKTPIDQDENQPDIDKTAAIRQRIVNAENMSINARNVKIITSQGKVTLRGPVNSAAEREAIVRFARDVAGEANVDDQLEVAGNDPNPNP